MEPVLEFIKKYKYPLIGALIAILILIMDLGNFLKVAVVIAIGIGLGFYIQNNKDSLKEKIKKLIDKM